MPKRVTYPGFPRAELGFLADLEKHNRTEWFHGNKATYDAQVRTPMLQLVEVVNADRAEFAAAYLAQRSGAVSRPNRDTRFSKDKSPYRTDISAVFPRAGLDKQRAAGFSFASRATAPRSLGCLRAGAGAASRASRPPRPGACVVRRADRGPHPPLDHGGAAGRAIATDGAPR